MSESIDIPGAGPRFVRSLVVVVLVQRLKIRERSNDGWEGSVELIVEQPTTLRYARDKNLNELHYQSLCDSSRTGTEDW